MDDDRGRHAGARLATVFGTRGAHARRQAGRADGVWVLDRFSKRSPFGARGGKERGRGI